MQSSALVPVFGFSYVNQTGATVGLVVVSYHGEQWRLGNNTGRVDRLDFQVSYGATSVADPLALWLDIDPLDFVAPVNSGTLGALDGNTQRDAIQLALDLRVIAALLNVPEEMVLIPDGATLWVRWRDHNASGSDDGLAIDDFAMTLYCGADRDCDDGVACTADICLAGVCQHAPEDTVCDDQVACTWEACDPSAAGADPSTGCTSAPNHALCADDAFCTIDACAPSDPEADPLTGCLVTMSTGSCDDGSVCTLNDVCEAGTCQPGKRQRYCGDGNECTDDLCDPIKGCYSVFNSRWCSDRDNATANDRCTQGTCVGDPIVCPTPGPCQTATPNGAYCQLDPRPSGTPCDDDSLATRDDACDGEGHCVGATIACAVAGPCELPGIPDGVACPSRLAPAGSACDDGLATTAGDRCDSLGGCSGVAIVCPPPGSCELPAVPNGVDCTRRFEEAGAPCDDEDITTSGDQCDGLGGCAGVPILCGLPGPCQIAGTPDGVACTPVDEPAGAACDDGDLATRGDACDGSGACAGVPIVCERDTECAAFAPNGIDCTMTPRDGPCDDGLATTREDACHDGACLGTAYACTPAACELTSVPDGDGCVRTLAAAGAPCDDGAPDTRDDRCDGAGVCAGTAFSCAPGPCETASVPDGKGCLVTPASRGTACDDGDPCTSEDMCDGVSACAGEVVSCGIGERCDPVGVCRPTHCNPCEADEACGDGSACVEVGEQRRCLVACDSDGECAPGQTCDDHESGGMRCLDREGECAAAETEAEAEAETQTEVETQTEADLVEPGPDEPERVEPPAEKPAGEVVDGEEAVSGGASDDGCAGGAVPSLLAMLALWVATRAARFAVITRARRAPR